MQDYTDLVVRDTERFESRPGVGMIWHMWWRNVVTTIARQGPYGDFLGVLITVDNQPDLTPGLVFRAEIIVAGFDVQIRRYDIHSRDKTIPNPGQDLTGVYRGSFALVPPGLPRTCNFVIGTDFVDTTGQRTPIEWRAVVFPEETP